MDEVLAKLSEMNDNFSSLREEVDRLKEERRARSRSPIRRLSGRSSEPSSYAGAASKGLWCDRDPSERVDYSQPIFFYTSDDEGEGEDQLVDVSENTRKLLTDSCTRSVSNELRKKTRSPYPLPRVPATRTPRIDHFMRAEILQASKSLDKDLAKIQTFALDAMAPLTAMVENVDTISKEDLQLALTSAIQLIGNTSARISHLRREKIVSTVNKSLVPLVKEDKDYVDAYPDLFGADFAKRSKEFLDQVKALRSSLPNKSEVYKKPLFRKGQSSGRTGAFRRGGGPNQFRGGRGSRPARQDNRN